MKNKAATKPVGVDKQSLVFAKNAFENSIQEQVGFLRKQIAIGLVNKIKSKGVKAKKTSEDKNYDNPLSKASEEFELNKAKTKPKVRFENTLLQKIEEEPEQNIQEKSKIDTKTSGMPNILSPNFLKNILKSKPPKKELISEEPPASSGINIAALPENNVINEMSDFLKVFGLKNKGETDQFVEVVHPETGFKIKILKDLVHKITSSEEPKPEPEKVIPVEERPQKKITEPTMKPLKMNTAPSDQQASQTEGQKRPNVMDFLDDMSIDDSFSEDDDGDSSSGMG